MITALTVIATAFVVIAFVVEHAYRAELRRREASADAIRAASTWADVRPLRKVAPELPRPLPRIAKVPAAPRPGSVPPRPPVAAVR